VLGRIRLLVLAAAMLACCGLAAAPAAAQSGGDCNPAPQQAIVGDAQAASPSAPNPLVGLLWFVDQGKYFVPWQKYLAATGEKKSLIGKIALSPQFRWLGRWDLKYGSMGIAVRQYLERVYCTGGVAQIATFLTQAEECHSRYQGGGPSADAAFRRNIKSLAEGIGTHRVVIAYEPAPVQKLGGTADHWMC
jgi:hypothetical protein